MRAAASESPDCGHPKEGRPETTFRVHALAAEEMSEAGAKIRFATFIVTGLSFLHDGRGLRRKQLSFSPFGAIEWAVPGVVLSATASADLLCALEGRCKQALTICRNTGEWPM